MSAMAPTNPSVAVLTSDVVITPGSACPLSAVSIPQPVSS
jgi:hypothetical protein